jgi:ATP-binding cassette subfamily B protein
MNILSRLLRYAYRYRAYTVLAYLCLLAMTGLNLLQPLIIKGVFDRGLAPPGDAQFLLLMAGALVVVNVASSLFNFGMTYLNEFVSQRVAYDLRNALYDHLQRLSFAYHDRAKTGELMSRVTSDVDSSRIFVGQGVLQTVQTVVLYVSVLVLMFSLHWQLALLSVLVMPFLAYTAIQYGTKVRPMYSRVQRQWAQLTAILQENITGVRVVKAFARERFEVEKFASENVEYMDRNITASRLQALVYPLMLFITSIGTIFILWYGGLETIRGNITIGTLLAFNSYLARLAQPTRMLGFIIGWISRATASGERLFEVLDAPSPVREKPGAIPIPPIEGHVVFDHVTFSYAEAGAGVRPARSDRAPLQPRAERITDHGFVVPRSTPHPPPPSPSRGEGERAGGYSFPSPSMGEGNGVRVSRDSTRELALQDVSFTAEPDQVVALLGHTGAGKTSIVALIPRFYDVTQGAVRIDGHDVRDVQLKSLRQQVGIVMQETLLFSATVAENIAYGRPDASLSDIERAAKAAQAYEFIQELPDGFNTKIGERGVTLSGGQRQRVAIARALLIDPRILILDDATASVDMRTEFLIQQALDELMKGRTTFVIAQRLTTIKNADQILVLDHGRVVQRGKHEQLVAQEGPYREIYDLQLRDQEQIQREMQAAQQLAP